VSEDAQQAIEEVFEDVAFGFSLGSGGRFGFDHRGGLEQGFDVRLRGRRREGLEQVLDAEAVDEQDDAVGVAEVVLGVVVDRHQGAGVPIDAGRRFEDGAANQRLIFDENVDVGAMVPLRVGDHGRHQGGGLATDDVELIVESGCAIGLAENDVDRGGQQRFGGGLEFLRHEQGHLVFEAGLGDDALRDGRRLAVFRVGDFGEQGDGLLDVLETIEGEAQLFAFAREAREANVVGRRRGDGGEQGVIVRRR
jgi:hypothetical protein